MQGDDARRVGRKLLVGLRHHGQHLVQDVQPALIGLLQGFLHHLQADALDLDVHLQGGDAVRGAGDFEVHVAQVIFHALDVGQDGVAAAVSVCHQAHGDARHRRLDRHARIHQRQRAAAHRGHGGRAIGAQHFRDQTQGVGELFLGRDHGEKRPLGQRAVADLAALGAAHGPGLAGREGREVVVVHVALGLFRGQGVQLLGFARGAQRGNGQHLRLAAGEQAGAVHARQHAGHATDGPDLGGLAAIGAHALVEDLLAHARFEHRIEGAAQLGLVEALVQLLTHLDAQLVQGRAAFFFQVAGLQDAVHTLADQRLHSGLDLIFGLGSGELELGLADLLAHALLHGDKVLDAGVGELERLQHHVLRHLVGAGLDHQDRVGRAGHAQVQGAGLHLGRRGVGHEAAVDVANAHRAHGAVPRYVADGQRDRGRVDGQHVQQVLAVGGQRSDDDLHLVAHALGEERAQRPVGQARGQDGALGGPALAAEEGAGDAAGRVELFFELDAQGEEVDALAHGAGTGGGGQQDRLAGAQGDRAAGQQGQRAGLDHDLVVADMTVELILLNLHGCPYLQGWVMIATAPGQVSALGANANAPAMACQPDPSGFPCGNPKGLAAVIAGAGLTRRSGTGERTRRRRMRSPIPEPFTASGRPAAGWVVVGQGLEIPWLNLRSGLSRWERPRPSPEGLFQVQPVNSIHWVWVGQNRSGSRRMTHPATRQIVQTSFICAARAARSTACSAPDPCG